MTMSTPPKHRIRNAILLTTLSIVGGLLLAQCRSVTDNVFGKTATVAKAANCMQQCADQANDLTKAENQLHNANVQACNASPSCLEAEEARHEAAKNAITASRKSCQGACHDQGGGQGR